MELWRDAWQRGFAPVLSLPALIALRDALRDDDPRLIQGVTTEPVKSMRTRPDPVQGACAIGFCGWQADGLTTVGEVYDYVDSVCFKADELLGAPSDHCEFLNWFDITERAPMRAELLPEVEATIARRQNAPPAA